MVQEGRPRAKDVSTGIREGNTIQGNKVELNPEIAVIIFGGKGTMAMPFSFRNKTLTANAGAAASALMFTLKNS